MRDTYIALGISLGGTALMLRPIRQGSKITAVPVLLCELEAKGLPEAAKLIGWTLIAALGAFHPEVDRYPLRPAESPPVSMIPINPPLNFRTGEMRRMRMGLGLGADATGPTLQVRTYDCDKRLGQDHQQSIKQLAELGESVAPSLIGELMLRKLAAMYPDVIPPLFPTMAL